jgi:hypothetical protein
MLDSTPPPLTPEEYARRLHELRTAFDRCHAALVAAADKLAMSAGLAMNEPSRVVIRSHAQTVRQEADRVAAMVEG